MPFPPNKPKAKNASEPILCSWLSALNQSTHCTHLLRQYSSVDACHRYYCCYSSWLARKIIWLTMFRIFCLDYLLLFDFEVSGKGQSSSKPKAPATNGHQLKMLTSQTDSSDSWRDEQLTHEPYEDVERVEGAEVGEVALVVAALRQEVLCVPPQLLKHSAISTTFTFYTIKSGKHVKNG